MTSRFSQASLSHLSPEDELLIHHLNRVPMTRNTLADDAEVARNLAEQENAIQIASDIATAHQLASGAAVQQQEIAFEEGQRNLEDMGRLAGAWADANVSRGPSPQAEPAAAPPTEKVQVDPAATAANLPKLIAEKQCLLCDKVDHLHEIPNVGTLCFTCLQHNNGAELERLVHD